MVTCILGAGPAHADVMSLEQAVLDALRYHPSVEAAMAGREASKETLAEERSAYFPQLNVNASAGRLFGDNSTTRGLTVERGAAYSYFAEGSVSATQPIFDGFETQKRVAAAKSRSKGALYDIGDVREDLGNRTVRAYLNVLRTRLALSMAQAHLTQLNDAIDTLKAMVNEGAADEAEIRQAEDLRSLFQEIDIDLAGQKRQAEANFKELTGRLPEGDLVIPTFPDGAFPDDVEQAIAVAVSEHPALQSVAMEAEASRYEIDAERGTLYPDLDGEVSYLESDKREVLGGEVVDARALLRLTWGFSTGGAELARIRREKKEYLEQTALRKDRQRQIERDIRLAFANYETSLEKLALLQERENSNKQLLETYKSQFEGGVVGLLQVVQAENQLFRTTRNKLNAEFQSLAARYAILASMGQLQQSLNIVPDRRG